MSCKFCGGEMDQENLICPACGRDNGEQTQQEVETVAAEAVAEEHCEVLDEKTERKQKRVKEKKTQKKLSKQQKKLIKIIAAVAACLVLVFFLVATICDSVGISIHPGANTLQYKKSYTASDSVANMAADRVIATVGDAELTNGELQVYYWMQYYDFVNYYGSSLSSMGLDVNKDLDKQMVPDTDLTWQQFFLDAALGVWHQYQSVQMAADAADFEISEYVWDALAQLPATLEAEAEKLGFKTMEEYVKHNAGAGSVFDDYMQYATLYNTSLNYYNYIYKNYEPTPEEVAACFEKNAEDIEAYYGITKDSGKFIDVRHILISPEGETGDEGGNTVYSDSEWEACRQKAQKILDDWKAGEATEESFAKMANELSEDTGSNTAGGLYTFVAKGQMVDEFEQWCFDDNREPGDTGLVRTQYGYHVMYFVYGNDGWYRYAEEILASEYCQEQITLFTQTYPMKVNYKKIALAVAGSVS